MKRLLQYLNDFRLTYLNGNRDLDAEPFIATASRVLVHPKTGAVVVRIDDSGVLRGTGIDSLMPVGTILLDGGITAPTGWAHAYGQAVSRVTYAALFARYSTTYGVGDGSTTFNLPDLRGRVPAGQDDMGGASANRLAVAFNGDTLGAVGGAESVILASNQVPTHNTVDVSGGGGVTVSQDHTSSAAEATPVVQPTIILNYIVKLT